MPRIQPAKQQDHPYLLVLWGDSVRATHHFLSEAEIQLLVPVVRDMALPNLEVFVLDDESQGIVGFMGLDGASLEALFIAPSYFRRGGGKLLVDYARQLKGQLSVSVNEQNPAALAFYESLGFKVMSRSDVDHQGNPYPILNLCQNLNQAN